MLHFSHNLSKECPPKFFFYVYLTIASKVLEIFRKKQVEPLVLASLLH
jgi:hypothetical protein